MNLSYTSDHRIIGAQKILNNQQKSRLQFANKLISQLRSEVKISKYKKKTIHDAI